MSNKISNQSFVTLATNDNYVLGALNLGQALKKSGTSRMLTVLISSSVSNALESHLRAVYDHVIIVDVMNSEDSANLALLKRPELGVTFTKLHCWRLEQFEKCVFLDADCLVVKNVDELFEREEFSAVTDVGWPDCFNSGVFVYKPSLDTYSKLVDFAVSHGSFDGGDQGLLNSFFSGWSTAVSSRRLPFIYNMTTNVSYSYAPAFKTFHDNVKIVHFIGAQKPWYYSYNLDTQQVIGGAQNCDLCFLKNWWSLFVSDVLPSLNNDTKFKMNTQLIRETNKTDTNSHEPTGWNKPQELAHQDTTQYETGQVSSGGIVVGSNQHQNLWESGNIEYKGRDSFDNIKAHLDSQLKK